MWLCFFILCGFFFFDNEIPIVLYSIFRPGQMYSITHVKPSGSLQEKIHFFGRSLFCYSRFGHQSDIKVKVYIENGHFDDQIKQTSSKKLFIFL
jgi:hypothetical protein